VTTIDVNSSLGERLGDLGEYAEVAGDEPMATILQDLGGLWNYRFRREFGEKAYREAIERVAEAVTEEAKRLLR
jgi:hypothetical protein